MIGKQHYDAIDIPEQLADVIAEAQQKAARKRQQTRRRIRYASIIAACIAVLLVLFQVPTVAKAIYPIPVLGSIVKVLQFGHGGEMTDGAHVQTTVTQNALRIHCSNEGQELAYVPAYTVKQESAPDRLLFTFQGHAI